jgi:hypothetical protein
MKRNSENIRSLNTISQTEWFEARRNLALTLNERGKGCVEPKITCFNKEYSDYCASILKP